MENKLPIAENDKSVTHQENVELLSFLFGEISFVLVPFLVMIIIFPYKGEQDKLFTKPEWSLTLQ